METLNESLARKKANLEIANGRLNTLREHYNEQFEKLSTIKAQHPDYISPSFVFLPFDAIPMKSVKDELDMKMHYLDDASKCYVTLMNEYERIKDSHPELFDKYGRLV